MLALSTWASSIISPVLTSLSALSTDCGLTWLAAPRSSPAPHFDGQRSLSAGGNHDGVWALTASVLKRSVESANASPICFMFSSPWLGCDDLAAMTWLRIASARFEHAPVATRLQGRGVVREAGRQLRTYS